MTQTFALPKGLKADELGFVTVPAECIEGGVAAGFSVAGMSAHMVLQRRGLYWNRSKLGRSTFEGLDEVQFLLDQAGAEKDYMLALPLVSGNLRAYLRGTGESLELVWDGLAPGEAPADAALLLVISGEDPIELTRQGVRRVRERLGTFRLREEKARPELLQYLGWCTWDAFYHEVNAEKVLQGLESFAAGGVRPGFVILDDGWLDRDENEFLQNFSPNPAKFPEGLAPVIAAAKSRYGVKMFGIWHAFEGYWRGVKTGPLGKRYRTVQNIGDIRPWAPKDIELSLVHPEDVFRFFQDFHSYLRQQGADFVKVDGQSALEVFTKGKLGRVSTMQAYQYAFQGSIQTHFKGNAISCMSNGSDVAYNMLAAPIWRNSQDFFPKDPTSHGKHILWNAMSALWAGEFCIPDWDMFWSNNPEGEFHAMARAISGGPVYVSDKPEAHDFDVLGKLVASDGRLLVSDRPALPAASGIFVDFLKEERLLKLTNRSAAIGVIGIFNCREEQGEVTDTFSPGDLHDVAGREFAVYLHKAKSLHRVSRRGKIELKLGQLGAELAVVSPVLGEWIAPLGLIEKYNSPAAITRIEMVDEGELVIDLSEGGVTGFWCAAEPSMIAVSRKSKISFVDGLLRIETKTGGPVKVQITR